jgi:hypothetical protein
MFGRDNFSVDIGGRFLKADDPSGRVWVVVRMWNTPEGLAHAKLEAETNSSETRIISISALSDPHFYLPLTAHEKRSSGYQQPRFSCRWQSTIISATRVSLGSHQSGRQGCVGSIGPSSAWR